MWRAIKKSREPDGLILSIISGTSKISKILFRYAVYYPKSVQKANSASMVDFIFPKFSKHDSTACSWWETAKSYIG